LQAGTFAFVYGEPRTGNFYTQFKIDEVVFLCQIPVRKRFFSHFRQYAAGAFNDIVFGMHASGHTFVGHVGYLYQQLLKTILRIFQGGFQASVFIFDIRSLLAGGFSLLLFAFLHQQADGFGQLVEFRQGLVQFGLCISAAKVEFQHFVDESGIFEAFFGETCQDSFFVVSDKFEG